MDRIRALNLGCGNDYRTSTEEVDWVNVDSGECKKDYYLNIEHVVWTVIDDEGNAEAIAANTFDHIEAIQVLEHIHKANFVNVIREMYRVSRNGATWKIAVPHGLSDNYITDPTHQMPFSTRTFDYFIDGTQLRENGRIYGWGDVCLRHQDPPRIDGNYSINFTLGVVK